CSGCWLTQPVADRASIPARQRDRSLLGFILGSFPHFLPKGCLPFLTKKTYHTPPPTAAMTTSPPITHQRTGEPEEESVFSGALVSSTALPEASNSSRPLVLDWASGSVVGEGSGVAEGATVASGVWVAGAAGALVGV